MSTLNPDDRAALIDGLLALACFLEAHPEAPVPERYDDAMIVHVFPDGDTDDERRAAVDSAVAACSASPPGDRDGQGHYKRSTRVRPAWPTAGDFVNRPPGRAV